MAYIFTTIGISVINTVSKINFPVIGFIIINILIVLSVFVLEEYLQKNMYNKYSISYDNLDLLKPGGHNKLIKDLSSRTGHNILRVKIRNIDLKREVAQLDVFFKE
jgi:hypothetical protein